MSVATKRSSMTFYSNGVDHYSHRVRVVLAEKSIGVDTVDVDPNNKPEDLADLNPYNTLPTLVDRGLMLYNPDIMMEYLDERFPHPPLLSVYPVARAQSRQWIHRINTEWCPLVDALAGERRITPAQKTKKRRDLALGLMRAAPLFGRKPFFLSEEFTIVDCCILPILWRLPELGIDFPKTRALSPLRGYRDRLFRRDSFRRSLSEPEREMKRER